MRKYSTLDERKIRVSQRVRDWAQSGFLEQTQVETMLQDLKVDLRQTNFFLRIILFAFSLLVIAATVMLIGMWVNIRSESEIAVYSLLAAGVCILIAEIAAGTRAYRMGFEEAAALAAAVLLGLAGLNAAEIAGSRLEFSFFAGVVTFGLAALGVYLRYGYLYAAFIAMAALSASPFQRPIAIEWQRMIAIAILGAFFVLARGKYRQYRDEYPGDDYDMIQAIAWLGIYAYLNLAANIAPFGRAEVSTAFYWFTYVAVWVLPVVGLLLAIRDRDRPFLDVNLIMATVTLASNKPYFGLPHETWDPILFGLLLIGTALGVRKLLTDEKHGFTASRILRSDKSRVMVVGSAAAALHTMNAPTSPTETYRGEGGRSGGAGASGTF